MKRDAAIILPPPPPYKSKEQWKATCIHKAAQIDGICPSCLQAFIAHNAELNERYSLSRKGHVAAHITRDDIVRNQAMIDQAKPDALDATSDDLDFAGIEEGSDVVHTTGFAQVLDHDADVDYESAIMEDNELPTDGEDLEEEDDSNDYPYGEIETFLDGEPEEMDTEIDPFDATNVDEEDDDGADAPEDFQLD